MPTHEIQRPAPIVKETYRYEDDLSAKEKAEAEGTRFQKKNGDKVRAQCSQAQTAAWPQEPIRVKNQRESGRLL